VGTTSLRDFRTRASGLSGGVGGITVQGIIRDRPPCVGIIFPLP
jgi:hypothetical protein